MGPPIVLFVVACGFGSAEDWTFNPDGLMWKRQMSGNNVEIADSERWFKDKTGDEEYDAVNIGPEHW